MSDERVDELEEKVDDLNKEINRIKNNKESLGELQNESEKADSELSRRDFLKSVGAGTAAAGAMAMLPSASALDFESGSGFSFGNQTSTNFELGSSGNLNLKGGEIQNAGAANVDKLSVGGDGPAESFSEIGGVSGVEDAVIKLEGGTPTAFSADGSEIARNSDAAVVFQAAFDALQSSGGTIRVGPGEFPVDQDVTPYSNTTFAGAGMGQTVLKATSTANFGAYGGGSPNPTNLTLRDFTYDGQNQGGYTRVYSSGGTRCKALRVAALNCGERGGGTTAGGIAWRTGEGDRYNQILNCYAENCAYVSLSTQKQGEYNEIRGCTVVNPNTSGGFTHPISVESNTNSVMADNTVIGGDSPSTMAGNPALNANAATGSVISNNNVRWAIKGINIANGGGSTAPRAGAVIDGNSIQQCVEGIRVQNSSTSRPPEEILISNNLIRDSIEPKDHNALNSGSDDFGILLNNNARANIVGNSIIRCGPGINGNGIGGPITISSNYFKDSGLGIGGYGLSEFSGSGQQTHVVGNHFRNAGATMNVPVYLGLNSFVGSDNMTVKCTEPNSFVFGNVVNSSGFGQLTVQGENSSVIANSASNRLITKKIANGRVILNEAGTAINDNTTGTNYLFNTATITENGGSASVADGDTIAHGLSFTPTNLNVTSSAQGHIASVSSVDSSDITVKLSDSSGSAVTSAETVYWEAKVR